MIHKITAQIFSKNLTIKQNIAAILSIFLLFSCASKSNLSEPKWYLSPTQNNSEFIYGTAQGYTLSQATRLALADAASRLITTISANTTSISQESDYDTYEEIRQKVSENIEKITFGNYKLSKSKKVDQNYFVEVAIPEKQFLREQKQRLYIVDKKISQLDKSSKNTNQINRRNHLLKINELAKEASLKLRILSGANQIDNINEELTRLLKYQSELEKFTNKIEFYIPQDTNILVKNTIIRYLNKDNIKVSKTRNRSSKDQIFLKISLTKNTQNILDNFITQTNITFKNILDNKIIASNNVTLIGSSTINEQHSFTASIKELDEKIKNENILTIIGILSK